MGFAELYFWAKKQTATTPLLIANILLCVGAVFTLTGVLAASMFMWWPRIIN